MIWKWLWYLVRIVILMEAKKLILMLGTLFFLQTSSARFDSFWPFSTHKNDITPVDDNWNELSTQQQESLLQRYQNLKDIPEAQRSALQQKMDWFTQLPEDEQQKMREAWQQMNNAERQQMKKQMQQASSKEERDQIREDYLNKYQTIAQQDLNEASMPITNTHQ